MKSSFLNVDLDIHSPERPILIEKELSTKRISKLYGGNDADMYLSTFRIEPTEEENFADSAIQEICKQIQKLSTHAKKEWNAAYQKTLDIGYQCKGCLHLTETKLNEETIREIGYLGLSLSITIYPKN